MAQSQCPARVAPQALTTACIPRLQRAPRSRITAGHHPGRSDQPRRPAPAGRGWPATVALLVLVALLSGCTARPAAPRGVASLGPRPPVAGSRAAATTTTTAGRGVTPGDAALAYARCMRAHGIDMPDPTTTAPSAT
ncbi:MAG TPA: hypothetical protein VG276_26205 [Actinomycetes bacterium]|nr:hypothetical protein [Actinomycetes bacterium]